MSYLQQSLYDRTLYTLDLNEILKLQKQILRVIERNLKISKEHKINTEDYDMVLVWLLNPYKETKHQLHGISLVTETDQLQAMYPHLVKMTVFFI